MAQAKRDWACPKCGSQYGMYCQTAKEIQEELLAIKEEAKEVVVDTALGPTGPQSEEGT
jgi:phage baseplate assembly protein gpV